MCNILSSMGLILNNCEDSARSHNLVIGALKVFVLMIIITITVQRIIVIDLMLIVVIAVKPAR